MSKVALVTGAARGIGAAVTERLIADGFTVAAIDLNDELLREQKKTYGDKFFSFVCDQTDEGAVVDTIDQIESKIGPIEAFVNVTGWTGGARFDEEKSDYWNKVIAINYQALLYVSHPVVNAMIKRKRGKIVFIASDAARVGTSSEAVYAGAKGAVISFAKSLARENARHNINVNVVCPGPTETPLLRIEMENNPDQIQRMSRLIPFRRLGQPSEQAAAVSFFLSKDSDYITGQTLSVSGGLTMA